MRVLEVPVPASLVLVAASMTMLMGPSLAFQPLSPVSSAQRRIRAAECSYQESLLGTSATQLNLFMINFGGEGDNNEKKKNAATATVDGKEEEEDVKASKSKSMKTGEQNNDVDETFSAFLQRMRQWPGGEESESDNSKEKGKLSSSPEAVSEPRNPFLSPFASLLNFEEVINSKEQEIPGAKKLKEEDMNEISAWGGLLSVIKESFGSLSNETMPVEPPPSQDLTTTTAEPQNLADDIVNDVVKEASNRVESVVSAASTAVSPDVFGSIIKQARNALRFQDDFVEAATSAARDQGLDDSEAAERARNTTDYVADLVSVADRLLRFGYVKAEDNSLLQDNSLIGDRKRRKKEADKILEGSTPTSSSGTLFENIGSARAISYDEFGPGISTLAEYGWLAGGIYEKQVERPHELGHSIVAEGISSDIYWMVTDSIENENDFKEREDGVKGDNISVRTIIIRGYDASDERVDREKSFTEICNAQAKPFDEKFPDILVHRGLFNLATSVYEDVRKYIDWSAPAQKIVFTGHSVGGTLSVLLTLMLARDRGAEFVQDKVLRVFTFGSPPAMKLAPDSEKQSTVSMGCEILGTFGLPATLVYGCIQPWDPIPRLFSPIDGLYPLLDDIGEDGVTLYANGPPRTLRFVTRALIEAWEGWPKFRDMIADAGPQNFHHVGIQHIMLPEPVRFLTDRFVNVNVNIPEVDEIVRLSTNDLYNSLETIFPLDVFELSFLTAGIRGFVHHFFPAYDAPLVDYAQKVGKRRKKRNQREEKLGRIETTDPNDVAETDTSWGKAERWLRNVVPPSATEPSR